MKQPLFRYFLTGFLALSLVLGCLPRGLAAWEPELLFREPLARWLWQRIQSGGISDFYELLEELEPERLLPRQTGEDETQPETQPEEQELWFGQLHSHTAISDGTGSVEEAFQTASEMPGLDFFAVTDHSDSFDNDLSGSLDADGAAVSADWARGKAAAASVTDGTFVGIFGYEMSWPRLYQVGHIGTFATPGFQSTRQEGYDTYDGALERYYAALAESGGIGQFNHPGTQYGRFQEFDHWTAEADQVMALLEAGGEEGLRNYVKALDKGWHVAPTNNQTPHSSGWTDTGGRTVLWAPALTEEALYEAMRSRRVYATEDPDLEIRYTLNGCPMGQRVPLADLGEGMTLSVTVQDPTDAAVGTVEVITTGGQALTSQYLAENTGELTFSLPAEEGYYFLRITQPDGETALTAPVWVEGGRGELAITAFQCTTDLPVQNEPVELAMEFVNGTGADFDVRVLEILADGRPVAADAVLTEIPARSTLSHTMSIFCGSVGMTALTLRITGTLGQETVTLEQELMVSFQQSELLSAIAVDGSHGNTGLEEMTRLTEQAMEESIEVAVLGQEAVASQLERYRFFLISAPAEPFSQAFLDAVSEFLSFGGTLVVCGRGGDEAGTRELNRLLSCLGSSMVLHSGIVTDTVNNGGSPEEVYTDGINRESAWCTGISRNQVYRQISGGSVTGGTWLVKGRSTTQSPDGTAEPALLAAEEAAGGGTMFAAGTLFCQDSSMEEPRNLWDEPYANYTLAHTLLAIGGEAIPLSTVQQARAGQEHGLFRIRGYVTAGTSNPHTTFPRTLYVQDDTGGIGVIPYAGEAVQQGSAVEIIGYAGIENGNRILKPSRWKILEENGYLYEPRERSWGELLDPDKWGGTLVQVEGTCLEVTAREDGTLAGCLLQDGSGHLARVKIEDFIGNGSDGGSDLHKTIRKGRTVRAMGILHIDEYGDTVIRVRNCEEVVYVPPVLQLLTNPRTADGGLLPVIPMAASFGVLLLLKKRPYRGKYQR